MPTGWKGWATSMTNIIAELSLARLTAEQFRDLLALVVVYHQHKDRFPPEIEQQIDRIDEDVCTLPWETEKFSIEACLKRLGAAE